MDIHYINLLQKNRELNDFYYKNYDAIYNEKQRQANEAADDFRLNQNLVLKNLIDDLNDKLQFFKLCTKDLGLELLNLKKNLISMEDVATEQESILNDPKKKQFNLEIEREVNIRIHEMRENFIKKYNELKDFKEKYINDSKMIENSHLKIMDLQQNLKLKQSQLNKITCCINESKDKIKPNSCISDNDFDKLQKHRQCILKNCDQIRKNVNCIKSEIDKTHKEINIIKKLFKSSLKIINSYKNWTKDQISKKRLTYFYLVFNSDNKK
ncbi:hypothetical protein PVAND_003195 [Polypedilum vanderplanki]|uniref:Uncharacterized protein n=1 Tax=Polypedilum vanderplanki TaxID=319348 RepID=A0A9J6BTA7_POLVA|nr:hypothetical protein PVAND_003195 [Polypedilum vanderplanki]